MTKEMIYPSLICADQLRLEDELKLLVDNGLRNIHFDVMDGQFVPRYGMYPEQLKTNQDVVFDVHIMAKTPEIFIEATKDNEKVLSYTVHPEAIGTENVFRMRDLVIKHNKKFGIALNLSSDCDHWIQLAKEDDSGIYQLCFMGIHPGVLAQTPNITKLYSNLKKLKFYSPKVSIPIIQVDGGVNFKTISELEALGVNSFVAGTSSLYYGRRTNKDAPLMIEEMLNAI